MTLKDACQQCTEFKHLASILKADMERQAFKTQDYPLLKLKYNYLTELVNLIENETLKEKK